MSEVNSNILLSPEPLLREDIDRFVEQTDCGGVVYFVGNVRNTTQNKAVENLFFEAYEPMAIKELQRIADAILAEFDVKRVAIHHRLGTALVGETAVIIGVSAPHRDAAFKACQFAIDTLKKSVPIWKKEYFADGGVWVSPNP